MSRNYSLLKFESISDICKNAGQVFLASMILEPMINKTTNVVVALLGIGLMCVFWSIGLSLSSK